MEEMDILNKFFVLANYLKPLSKMTKVGERERERERERVLGVGAGFPYLARVPDMYGDYALTPFQYSLVVQNCGSDWW